MAGERTARATRRGVVLATPLDYACTRHAKANGGKHDQPCRSDVLLELAIRPDEGVRPA